MDSPERSTIYLDLDDDITSIIGKLTAAEHNTVALVVPKRLTVLQSVVNLKLVKKAASEATKKPVLITEDPVITNIAGGQQMLVAASLQAEPKVPEVAKISQTSLPSDVIEGEALGAAAVGAVAQAEPATAAAAKTERPTKAAAAKAAAKKRIPDFGNFKKRFFLILAAIGAGGFLLWALFFWWPKAKVVIDGRTEPTKVAFSFTADTEVENPQYNNSLLPAHRGQVSKTLTKNITPTGKKDVGTKASGTVSIKNCEDTNERSLSSGTAFNSASGKTFLSDKAVTVPAGQFSNGGQNCDSATVEVPVSAKENGSSYNIGPTSYSSSSLSGKFIITDSQMSGGTSKTITVVTQGDVDAAKKELVGNERAEAKQELSKQFSEEEQIIEASYQEQIKKVSSDPAVGQEADSARVSVEVVYQELAIQKEYLDELVRRQGEQNNRDTDHDSLAIVASGIESADFKLKDKTGDNSYRFDVVTQALLGPDINFDELKERIAGKKFSEAVEIVKSYPNVSSVDIKFSPFYVRKVPSNIDKITVEIKLPTQQ